eukprot:11111742-Ditylum_brightwellii.AAC.1
MEIGERRDIKPLRWTPNNRKQTRLAGISCNIIANKLDLTSLEDLGALYFAAALTICNAKPTGDKPKKMGPVTTWKEKIEKKMKVC